ncbi:hypothetical protein Lgra_3387 [Legionella gratiana]|uniref:Uncharacterized protein n=2 Tax=Legionella gratiana TaxID=45066 RepID=A0A378JC78_9GAMM|nr:hypothetical protein Lgra_3387 [Legionella gratiana]STX45412.1 Uncharacterised protein [Legionella gratiana]
MKSLYFFLQSCILISDQFNKDLIMLDKSNATNTSLKDRFKNSDKDIRIPRNKKLENELLFFSLLSKQMRENPSKENLKALKIADEKINEMISSISPN